MRPKGLDSRDMTLVSMTETARELLRRKTAAAHAALEKLPGMHRLLQPDVTMIEYATVLEGFIPVHASLEPQAAQCAEWAPGCSGERLRAIEADLRDLARRPLQPPVAHAPTFAEPAAALGACYVLEGSFLGGTVIASQLQRHLGSQLPLRYFAAPHIDRGRRWRDFLVLLEQRLVHGEQRDLALGGARACYNWLQRTLP